MKDMEKGAKSDVLKEIISLCKEAMSNDLKARSGTEANKNGFEQNSPFVSSTTKDKPDKEASVEENGKPFGPGGDDDDEDEESKDMLRRFYSESE